jgi:hypothetical protein
MMTDTIGWAAARETTKQVGRHWLVLDGSKGVWKPDVWFSVSRYR